MYFGTAGIHGCKVSALCHCVGICGAVLQAGGLKLSRAAVGVGEGATVSVVVGAGVTVVVGTGVGESVVRLRV